MPLNQSYQKTKEYFLIPEDSHLAILYSVVDIGDQQTPFPETDENDKPIPGTHKVQSQVVLTFELQDVLMEDGRPAVISQTYTASLNDKAKLRAILGAALGGGKTAIDIIESETETVGTLLGKAVGKAVMLSIIHKAGKNGKTYANIGTIATLPSALKGSVKEPVNKLVCVTDVNALDSEDESKIPNFIKAKIAMRLNGPESKAANDGSCPF